MLYTQHTTTPSSARIIVYFVTMGGGGGYERSHICSEVVAGNAMLWEVVGDCRHTVPAPANHTHTRKGFLCVFRAINYLSFCIPFVSRGSLLCNCA